MYDLYRYIEHVTHMCLRSWSVLYSDHLNLEIPVDIKKKKFCVSKAQDVHVVSVSLFLLMGIPIERRNYLTLLCVWLEADITLQTIKIAMPSLHSNFSHFIHSQNQSPPHTPVKKVAKRYVHVCMYIYYLWIHRLKN